MPEPQTTISPEPKSKNLYNFLTQEGYDLGDYGAFDTKIQDAKLRKQFYMYFRGQGYDLGDLSSFESKVKKSAFDQPAIPAGFKSPEPPSKFEQAISDIDQYIGEQVLAPAALKAKRTLGGIMPESLRKATGFEMTPEQEKKAAEIGAPAIPLSKLTPSDADIEKLSSPYKQMAAAGKGALEAVEGLTTAENLAIASTLGGAPKAIQAIGSAGFAGLMASSLPEIWKAFKAAPTETEKIKLATHGLATLVFTGAAAKHAVSGGKGAVEEFKISRGQKKAIPELEQAAKTAEEITQVAESPQRLAERLGREELEQAGKTAREIGEAGEPIRQAEAAERAREFSERVKREEADNLSTPDLQLRTLSEQLAINKLEKPYESLSTAEKNQIDNLSGAEYHKRLRQIAKGLQVKNPDLRAKDAKADLEARASEILRKQLVDEKNARAADQAKRPEVAPKAEFTPEQARGELEQAAKTAEEIGSVNRPAEVKPEDVEIIPPPEPVPPAEIAAPPEVSRGRLTTPVAGELPGVTKTTTPAVETRRGEYVGEIPETRVPAAGRTQMSREEIAQKLEQKFPGKVSKLKEKPKAEKSPVTAETAPISGKEMTGQPQAETTTTDGATKPAARPAVNPEIAKLRPSEQLRRAQKVYDGVPKKEGWQDQVKSELENAGYPDNIVKFFTESERTARPDEPFGRHTATTREGRTERAGEPSPELKPKVDAIADAGRRNQIAQARYDTARKELLVELQKLESEGVTVKLDEKTGGYQISIRNPQVLTEKTKAIIKKIQQAEIDRGSYKPEMVSTDLQISVTPGAESLKGLSLLEGSLADKVMETLKRKEQAKKTQIVFDKLKAAYKDDLVDYYFTNESGALLGRTKEGLETEVLIRRAPSVKGAGEISVEAQKAIKAAKDVDRSQVDAGLSALENASSREAWNDKMVAKFGEQVKSRLDDIYDTAKYIQDNKFIEIRSIAKAIPETAAKKGFEFIRTKLSEADQAKFDSLLDDIKATDLEIVDPTRANNAFQVIGLTAKQYGNYAAFGYWTLKALGRAGANKAAWAAEMIKRMGDKIRPFLDDIWNKINADGYAPNKQFAETDLPKFNANTAKPNVERIKTDLPDDPPSVKIDVKKGADRTTPFFGAYQEQMATTLGRVSKKVEHGFRQAIDYWEKQEGRGQSLINPLARALRFKPTALNRIDNISRTDGISMWDNWHEWLAKPETIPKDLTAVERQAIDIYRKLLEERSKVLKEAGRENVEQVAFKRVPSFDLLDAIRSEGGTVWNTLVKELARLNDLPEHKVVSYLKRYRLEKFEKFPTHIKIGKGKFSDTVPILATQGLSALRALNRDTSRLAGVTKVFGDNYNKAFQEIRKQLPANFQADFDLARDAYFGVRRLENSRSLGKRLLVNLAQPIVRTALLARAAFYQPTQALAATRLITGKTLLRGLYDLAKKGTKAELEAISAYAPAILDLAWQKGQRIEDFGRIASEIGGNISLLKPAIDITDLGISAAFRRFALDIKERGGKLKPREKNTLEVLNFTPEQISLIDKKGFDGYKDSDVLYSAVINRGRKAVTFTGLKGPERTKFQLNPLISSLIQFQGFNIGQMQQAAGVIRNLRTRFEAVSSAKTPDEKRAAKAQLGSAAKQAAILLGATMTAAEANNLMRALINGQDPDRPEDLKRLFEDLVETGWLPFLREFSYGFASDPTKVILPFSIGDDIISAWVGKGRYKDYEGWERAALFLDRYATRPYTQTYDLPKSMLIATGLLEGNPTLKTATNYYWDFLKDEGQFKPSEREGYNEVQAALREIVKAVKSSEYGQFGEETRKQIRGGIAKAIKAKRNELIEQKRMDPVDATIESVKRIRQGLKNRTTLKRYFDEKIGKFKIGQNYYSREQLGDKLRGDKYVDALLTYDRLIEEIADSL